MSPSFESESGSDVSDALTDFGVDEASEQVESAITALNGLDQLPMSEHVAVFESVQQTLADTLSAVDEA